MNRQTAIKLLRAIVLVGAYGGLLIPLMFIPYVIFPFVFSKLVYFQVLIGLTFPAYLALAWAEPKFRIRYAPLLAAVFAYLCAVGLSVIFAIDPLRAWWGNQERMNGLFTVLHFFLWLVMVVSTHPTWKEWRRILWFQVVLGAVMAIIPIWQKWVDAGVLMFPAGDRPGGLLDNPIYMAGYQIFNLFFIVLLLIKGVSNRMKLLLGAFALLDVVAFVLAQSRGALLGLFVGILVCALVYAVLTSNRKARVAVLASVALLFLGYGLLYAFRTSSFVQSTPLNRLTDLHATTETRFIAWKIAWKGFLERPLTGWGFDNFHIVFNQKYNPESLRFGYYETWFDRSHNTVMDMLVMTGLFGFLTFFSIFGALFYSVIRAYRKGWMELSTASVLAGLPVAYFVQNLFVFDQPAGFTMSYFLFAFVICATRPEFLGKREESSDVADKPVSVSRPVPWISYGVLMVIACLIAWRYSIQPFRLSMDSIEANNLFATGLNMGANGNVYFEAALDRAKKVESQYTPYLDEQTFLHSRNLISVVERGATSAYPKWREFYDLVKRVTDKQLAQHPENAHDRYIYARFLDTFSSLVPEDVAAAEKQYKESITESPKRQQIYFSLGRFYSTQGRKQEAYEIYKQAADLDPEVGEARWFLGLTEYFDVNKKDEGAIDIASSTQVIAPYGLHDAREAAVVAEVFAKLGDKEGMKKLLMKMQDLPNGTPPVYMNVARALEKLGMIEQRNMILGALTQADPTLVQRMAPLTNGSATSIDDAFLKTANLVATTSPSTPTNTPPATQPSSGGSGPRRR